METVNTSTEKVEMITIEVGHPLYEYINNISSKKYVSYDLIIMGKTPLETKQEKQEDNLTANHDTK